MKSQCKSVKKMAELLDLTIEITRKCPLNCLICSSDAGLPYPKELETKEIESIVQEAKQLGCQSVCFSGGEPFEHSDLVDLCRYSKSLGLDIHIYTCGNVRKGLNTVNSISEEILRKIKPYVSKIIVGLQGPTPEIHESITRINGSFDNAVLSVKKAIKQSIPVEIHFVPVKINYNSVPEMLMLANKIGISKISVLRFVSQGRGKIYKNILSLSKDEVSSLKSILSNVTQSNLPLVRIGAPFSALGLSNAQCTAGENRATVRADGLVFPCEAFKQVEGTIDNDIHDKKLGEIWSNSQIFSFAREIGSHRSSACISCLRLEYCGGGCPAQTLNATNRSLDPYCLEKKVELKCPAINQ